MKITVTGSLGNVGRPLAEQLISEGHQVTIITSTPDRENEINKIGASAAVGSITDLDFLIRAFSGADAVFTMTPSDAFDPDMISNTIKTGHTYAEAITVAQVKKVVMLSSIGADLPSGNGPVKGIHHIEERFRQLENVAVTFLRPGFFYYNYFRDIPIIKEFGILGSNYPADAVLPLVHPKDIAAAAAEELTKPSEGKNVRYIVSDLQEVGIIASLLGVAISKPELYWVEFADSQLHEALLNAGLPVESVEGYVEMGKGFGSGLITKDFYASGTPVTGKIKLSEFSKEFAERFHTS
ncbi:NAD-dependent dehydratase [Flavobacterium akiainvivens]|uniref:NAD-dependent dehydratase n=1 Tax=Flavobacterium akiainvivens TaxID=1202724 RepID=A0A0M9VH43_9FLAO|nr:NAD(P)H-binding protein [Flavobacterium akiainvivens]KOS05142.1 NAD-dependent dehydratase [Flavobacterium akiainvivens]SFQ51213.1 Uncharacterized conserved protein YbjT, contains NAD(P)-binding and DUF2867 domains [Flavobacterium akiainvivens]